MNRFMALMLLFLPGIAAAIGIKLMRDALFGEYSRFLLHAGVQFFAGMVLFIGGLVFVGGFIVYRDRKNNRHAQNHRQ
ncbi:DUF2627 domain-containing protein [Aciduricibacillus chroicocephali]|uniref:DUF2627 domain-containing protein n=1 Tax=Aciduricibacillus chroicocephali TaxID=3054939 RepID=A0ABY9KRJ4_9BACI|nr:DUF2627 domain-containing protein [Bacillaceae bacterium 44XB]